MNELSSDDPSGSEFVRFQAQARDLQAQTRLRRAQYPGHPAELQRRIVTITVLSICLLGLMLIIGAFEITLLAAIPFALWAVFCEALRLTLLSGVERRFDLGEGRGARPKTLTLTPDGLEIETIAADETVARETIPWAQVDKLAEGRGQIVFTLGPHDHRGAPARAFVNGAEKSAFLERARSLWRSGSASERG